MSEKSRNFADELMRLLTRKNTIVTVQNVNILHSERLRNMSQQIENIKVKDLVLWTENPRDPITENSTDADVIHRAITDPNSKWDLKKLASDMGDYYDFSELPIVVYKGGVSL